MALAYSSGHTTLIDIIGRDAFVNALNDEPFQKYQKYIWEWEPKTMESALYYASRSEAHDVGSTLRMKEKRDSTGKWNRRTRVNQIAQESEEGMREEVRKMRYAMQDLTSGLRTVGKEIQELKRNQTRRQAVSSEEDDREQRDSISSRRKENRND